MKKINKREKQCEKGCFNNLYLIKLSFMISHMLRNEGD